MSDNLGKQYQKKLKNVHKKLTEEMITVCRQIGEKLRDETVERTPVDQGDLRAK